jgi:hypothetical protein
MAFSTAFQRNAFQGNAFQTGTTVSDTDVLQLPINCILAGQQHYKHRERTWDIPPHRVTEEVTARGSSTRRLRGEAPTFTTRTGKRGYD